MSRRGTIGVFIVAGLLVCLALVFLVAPHASSAPDGLNRVAADHALDQSATPSPAAAGPLAGYQVHHVGNSEWSRGLAGGIGVGITFVLAFAGTKVLASRRTRQSV